MRTSEGSEFARQSKISKADNLCQEIRRGVITNKAGGQCLLSAGRAGVAVTGGSQI